MKKKLNVIDLLIILFLAAVIAAGMLYARKISKPAEEGPKTIVLEVTEKREGFLSVMQEGDQLWDGTQKKEFGVLKSVESRPASKDAFSQKDGKIRKVEIPERYDLYLTVEVPESKKVNVGKGLWLESQRYKCSGYVLEVSE